MTMASKGVLVEGRMDSEPNLEELLAEARRNSLTRDNPALATLPDWFTSLRDHQRVAIREILTAYEEGAKCVVLDAPTGCLAGDTKIIVNRGGNARQFEIKQLVHSFNGGVTSGVNGNRRWDLSIPTSVACVDDEGYMRKGKLKAAWCSGVKTTYTVKAGSFTIRATHTHPFLTPDGFVELGGLAVGSKVAVQGTQKKGVKPIKKHYRYANRLYRHPYATNKRSYAKCEGWRVPLHRLTIEAELNGISLDEYLEWLREPEPYIHPIFNVLDPNFAVHHRDGDSLNNNRDNLEVLTHTEHWTHEGQEKTWRNVARMVEFVPIESIEYHGEEMTYDLEMAEEPHNFIANGYAVHNSGKTLIGETVRRLLNGPECGRHSTYICSSKALQDQFLRDYPYAKVLKGRTNYATELYPERFLNKDPLTCADCTKSPGSSDCMWCSGIDKCPYAIAKTSALSSSLAVLNTSYFLSECNGPGTFSRGGLVIADEADCLESELMGHVEVRISERRLKQYGLTTPRFVTKPESWAEWAEEALAKVVQHPPRPTNRDRVLDIRTRKRHDYLVAKLRDLKTGLEAQDWVYTGDRTSVAFKPVTVSNLGAEKLWQHGDKWLLMSATVISADEMLESLGWDEDKEWRLVKCPSTFKPENRKVVVWPIVNMNYKNREAAWPEVTKGVITIAAEGHAEDRILIHSSSYSLTQHIVDGLEDACLGRPIFSYTTSEGKNKALEHWQASVGGIMVAPSLDRGIDLPGDACRIQVIVKVPFLSIKDKQVSARLYGTGRSGKIWYAVNAIRTIIQMCGRAVRSEEDYAITWILDRQFVDNLYGGYRNLIPEWWKESLVWKRVKE